MFELLFLLLPIAAAYGYYMGRNSYKHSEAVNKQEQTRNYLRGVDYLINNETEHAMDKFIAFLDSTDPTFESTLALGNLFRQRGEVDRAISLHNSLAVSPTIEPYESQLAQMELANDFISAGLLDRAEKILLELIEIPNQRKNAVKLLIKLYEQERDFEKSIECASMYKDALDSDMLNRICHHCCELAQKAVVAKKYKQAQHLINQALDWNSNSVRARLVKCDLLLKEDREDSEQTIEQILKLIDEIIALDDSCGLFCLELLQKTFNNQLDPRYRKSLEKLLKSTQSASVIVELSKVEELHDEHEQAEALLIDTLQERPNLRVFSAIMALRSRDSSGREGNNYQSNNVIMQLKSMVDAQIAASPQYHCSRCGFESNMMFWQCPSCRRYDTIRIKHSLDGD